MRLIDADKIKYDDIPIANARGIVVTRKAVMQKAIEDMPTIERPKGKWERDTITNLFHCSNCRAIDKLGPNHLPKYCDECGAEMEVEET